MGTMNDHISDFEEYSSSDMSSSFDDVPDFGEKWDADMNLNGYTVSDLHFGHRVLLSNGLAGSIRFMGKVDFDDGIWIGIDLKKKNCNGHNGAVQNRAYFEPKEQCGYFIKMNEINAYFRIRRTN